MSTSRTAQSLITCAALACGVLMASCGPESKTPSFRADAQNRLITTLDEAPAHGISIGDFSAVGLKRDLSSPNAQTRRKASEQLYALTSAYAAAQRGATPEAKASNSKWGLKPAAYDADSDLRQAIQSGRLNEWLRALPPPDARYEALRQAYASYVQIAANGGWPSVPKGPALSIGATGPHVVALRARLKFEDQTLASAIADAPYDDALAQALQRFQTRHGLNPDGVLDEGTLRALNVSAEGRVTQIRANLQRWRWAPREHAATRIEVNSAAGLADVIIDNAPVMRMRAATGKPGDETPMLASQIHTIVLNPRWNVPTSIAEEELRPKEAADPGYLERNGYIEEPDGEATRLVQLPGGGNALGQVKFLFDNPYSVYLHDTPSRAAFAREQRSVSHGCVRLERAVDLAKLLLQREGAPAAVDEVLAKGETTDVKLKSPVAVEIMYFTAFVEGGVVHFRDDIYQWDLPTAKLASLS